MSRPILVVEDHGDTRMLLSDILKLEGYEVVAARNGRVALDWVAEGGRPGVVLLDLMMPEVDGWQVMDALRADAQLASVPVVVITAEPKKLERVEGVYAKLTKPFDLPELLELVSRCMAA